MRALWERGCWQMARACGRTNGSGVGWILFLAFFAWGLYMWAKAGFHRPPDTPIP